MLFTLRNFFAPCTSDGELPGLAESVKVKMKIKVKVKVKVKVKLPGSAGVSWKDIFSWN